MVLKRVSSRQDLTIFGLGVDGFVVFQGNALIFITPGRLKRRSAERG